MRIRSVGNIGELTVQLLYDVCEGLGGRDEMAVEGGGVDNPVKEELLCCHEWTGWSRDTRQGSFDQVTVVSLMKQSREGFDSQHWQLLSRNCVCSEFSAGAKTLRSTEMLSSSLY